MGNKVLISGGLGFIGAAVARNLVHRGYSLRLLDNLSPQIHGADPQIDLQTIFPGGSVEFLRGDVRRRSDWVEALGGVSSVIHLAAETGTGQSMYRVGEYTGTNVWGLSLLLDVLANESHQVGKLVLTSSRAVYGEGAYECAACGIVTPNMRSDVSLRAGAWEPPCPSCGGAIRSIATPESAKTNPASIYAANKLAQEDLVRIACGALSIPFSILRLQNVYGEGQALNNPYTGILSIFSNRIRQQMPIYLFEDGQETRDFVHVSDVAEAVALSLSLSGGDGLTLNVGLGSAVSVETVARSLKRQFADDSEPIVSGQYRIGDIRHSFADLTLIRRALGFAPRVQLEEGLARFARWVRSQPVFQDGLDHANRELIERGLMNALP